ncbi:EKC/KEOPS complex subunit TP53RK-like [Clytia hemisphaerica]|uniref:EKC/KEOPS complex subunit TP53RK-like n=1 Tax=Clytia hemisphaerica TaxID=252671 RepID=UPI0034D5D7B6
MKLFKQGAEARLYKADFLGKKVIIKERFQKTYRHPQLDLKLTQKRTLQEARAILRCRKAGISTPLVYFIDHKKHQIFMEEILDSLTLRERIDTLLKLNTDEAKSQLVSMAKAIGKMIAHIHSVDIIHGDLTTSNILVTSKNDKEDYVLIDFGLSSVSKFSEDMGVDLYVLERAFLSTHPNTEWLFAEILDSYFKCITDPKRNKEIMEKLEEIRMRGRKRVMIG